MKISLYNVVGSPFSQVEELDSIFVYLLLAKEVESASQISWEILNYMQIDTMHDNNILDQLIEIYKTDDNAVKDITELKRRIKISKPLKQKKMKTRSELEYINTNIAKMHESRKRLRSHLHYRLEYSNLISLLDFEKEKIWKLYIPLDFDINNVENFFISKICKNISDRSCILGVGSLIQGSYKFSYVDENIEDTCEYININLWKFPVVSILQCFQMKHIRDGLQANMFSFYAQLEDCVQALSGIGFRAENYGKIRDIVYETIMPLKQLVQQDIDNSLYIMQLRNKNPNGRYVRFHLGITAAEKLVDYYQHAEMVEPYIASEIKDRLKRTMNLEDSCVFSYLTTSEFPEEEE